MGSVGCWVLSDGECECDGYWVWVMGSVGWWVMGSVSVMHECEGDGGM